MKPDETDPAIKLPKYRYGKSVHPHTVIVINQLGERKPYTVDALLKLMSKNMPEAFREMARGALDYIGYQESDPDALPEDLNILTIEGVKVYFSYLGKWVARVQGRIVKRNSLTNLAKFIKENH